MEEADGAAVAAAFRKGVDAAYKAVMKPTEGTILTVIRKAAELRAELIITHEPTWFTGRDDTGWLEGDPVYLLKKRLIEDTGVAIWRFPPFSPAARSSPCVRCLWGKSLVRCKLDGVSKRSAHPCWPG